MHKSVKEENAISDAESFMLVQFIDVLEVIESYETIEEVKDDIKQRKKMLKDDIELIKSKKQERKEKGKIIRLVFNH